MKKVLFFILLGSFLTIGTLSAQCCKGGAKKSCSKSSQASNLKADEAYVLAASDAAAKDASIEKRVCEKSGKVSFFRNTTDASGATASTEVMFDQGTATFVNSSSTSGKKSCCSKGSKSCSKDKEAKSENKIMN
ncbi:MAG: hypothetical protein IT267_10640 [Saprospiraceae bacterium]|nr:hypothetical protein [Saprospiraceae bacterium]